MVASLLDFGVVLLQDFLPQTVYHFFQPRG